MKDINLLPEDIKTPQEQVKSEKSSVSSVKIITIVIAVLALVGVSLILPKVYIITQNTRLDMINSSIESSKYDVVRLVNSGIAQITSEVNNKNNIVADIDKKNISVSEVLNIISSSTPKGCSLDKVTYSDRSVDIEGKTADPSIASELLSYLARIDTLHVNNTSIDTKDGKYNFKYSFSFGGKENK